MSNDKYSIPMINGEGDGLIFTIIDPNLPYEDQGEGTEQQVVNEWLGDNYPNISQDQLSDLGITISFVPGSDTYEINGVTVSEDEYNEMLNDSDTFEVENGNKIILNEYNPGSYPASETVGIHYKNPGTIKIEIDNKNFNEAMDMMLNGELTYEQATKLEEFIENVTGVANVTLQGLSIKGAYTEIKDLLAAEDIVGKDFQLAAVICSVTLALSLDIKDLEDIWDADESEIARALNKMAKTGNNILLLIGMIELVTSLNVSGAVYAGLVFTLVDIIIKDPDELEIFSLNYDGAIEYDFDLRNENGQLITYRGEIKLDYDDPQQLANAMNIYLESAKLQLSAQLDKLRNKREEIIKNVKQDFENEIYSLSTGICTSSSTIEGSRGDIKYICEVYGIERLYYEYEIEYDEQSYETPSMQGEFFGFENKYKVVFSYKGGHINYSISKVSSTEPTTTLDAITYEGESLFWSANKVIFLKTNPTYEEIKNHFGEYFKSYYRHKMVSNEQQKDSFIDQVAAKRWVNTGQLDITYEVYGEDVEAQPKEEQDNIIDLTYEADKYKANFMSRERNLLAKKLVLNFYNASLNEVGKYSNLTTQIESLEQEIVSAWDMVYKDKRGSSESSLEKNK